MASRLVPWTPRERRSVYLDPRTARGVDDAGRTVRPMIGGRRKHPNVCDLLDTVRGAGAERGWLVGPRPELGWLLVEVDGWTAGAHYLDADLPVARFTHDATGAAVELRRSAEWFGDGIDAPTDARAAWQLLGHHYGRAFGGARLFDSPAATGMDAWVRSLSGAAPPQLDTDTAALVRATSPQHRVEMFDHGTRQVPGFTYLDGRLQYAALTRELGTGPARMLTGAQAGALAESDPYARARFHVRATVPPGWDTLGVLMAPAGPNPRDGWHAPRQPGETFTTWCDAAELRLARELGWPVEVAEGLQLSKGRPLDTWTARLLRVRASLDTAPDAPPAIADAVRGALRNVLLHTVGAFHSTGRDTTRVVTNPMLWRGDPADLEQRGKVWIARQRVELTGRNLAFQHPEWSSQVWGRSHARILESPTGAKGWAGALQVPFAHVLGVRGDALYLTHDPRWPDDGKVGRLRSKGHLHGPLTTPTTYPALNELRERAERNGPTCPEC